MAIVIWQGYSEPPILRHSLHVVAATLAFLLCLYLAAGCSQPQPQPPQPVSGRRPELPPPSYAEQMGCSFTSPARAPLDSIATQWIDVPEFSGRWAIWGSTGRDKQGHLWFGVSAHDVQPPSAHLFEFAPPAARLMDRGNVVDELRKAGLLRPGEGQMKIHSRFVQAEDGHLYFSSFDEQGEDSDGSKLPTWGGHLWRLRLPDYRWEHLRATPEALIAVAGSGRWIYALGYFNHMLYQFDCRSGQLRSRAIGAAGGHISRNFLCDHRGHCFVPRVKTGDIAAPLSVALVELSPEFVELGQTPLAHYTLTTDETSHGITGVQPLADQSLVFTTDQGYLYRIVPREGELAEVTPLGWMHPEGRAYVASLFTSDGSRHLMAAATRDAAGGQALEWVVRDLATQTSRATPLELPLYQNQPVDIPLLYGSMTRDELGNCYLAGVFHRNQDIPLLLQIRKRSD